MESFIVQNPMLIHVAWVLLNLLYYCAGFYIWRLWKRYFPQADPAYDIKYDWKFFLRPLLFIGYGSLMFWGCQHVISQRESAIYTYFAVIGALFSLMIGFLLITVRSLINYAACRKEISQVTFPSFKLSCISNASEFFAFSFLMLVSFLITKNPFLLGGTVGFAFGGVYNIFEAIPKLEITKKGIRLKWRIVIRAFVFYTLIFRRLTGFYKFGSISVNSWF